MCDVKTLVLGSGAWVRTGQDLRVAELERSHNMLTKSVPLIERFDPQKYHERTQIIEAILNRSTSNSPSAICCESTNSFGLLGRLLPNHMGLIEHNSKPVDFFKRVCALLVLASRIELACYCAVGSNDQVELRKLLDVLDPTGTMIDIVSEGAYHLNS